MWLVSVPVAGFIIAVVVIFTLILPWFLGLPLYIGLAYWVCVVYTFNSIPFLVLVVFSILALAIAGAHAG